MSRGGVEERQVGNVSRADSGRSTDTTISAQSISTLFDGDKSFFLDTLDITDISNEQIFEDVNWEKVAASYQSWVLNNSADGSFSQMRETNKLFVVGKAAFDKQKVDEAKQHAEAEAAKLRAAEEAKLREEAVKLQAMKDANYKKVNEVITAKMGQSFPKPTTISIENNTKDSRYHVVITWDATDMYDCKLSYDESGAVSQEALEFLYADTTPDARKARAQTEAARLKVQENNAQTQVVPLTMQAEAGQDTQVQQLAADGVASSDAAVVSATEPVTAVSTIPETSLSTLIDTLKNDTDQKTKAFGKAAYKLCHDVHPVLYKDDDPNTHYALAQYKALAVLVSAIATPATGVADTATKTAAVQAFVAATKDNVATNGDFFQKHRNKIRAVIVTACALLGAALGAAIGFGFGGIPGFAIGAGVGVSVAGFFGYSSPKKGLYKTENDVAEVTKTATAAARG